METFEKNGLTFRFVNETKLEVIDIDKNLTKLDFPDKVEFNGKEYIVDGASSTAFEGCEHLTIENVFWPQGETGEWKNLV